MAAVWCVYAGAVTAFIGLAASLRPLPFLALSTGRRALVVALMGVFVAAGGAMLPAAETRVTAPATELDRFAPAYQFSERHTIHVDAPPPRVFSAIKTVTADEVFLFRTLVFIRRFGQPGPESILNVPKGTPILDVATRTTFLMLADAPPRELVVGTLVVFPAETRPTSYATPGAFRALQSPGFAKATMNFLVEPDTGGSRVTTETRVFATDASARRRFATYWRVIYPGSALIRRMWLRAIKRRAEAVRSAAPVYGRPPTANRPPEDRTYITPSDSAGVAISSSPIEFVAMWRNSGPAATTMISPSSPER